MPVLHPVTGEWCAGVGSVGVSREWKPGLLAEHAGSACWLGDRVLYQRESGGRAFLEADGVEIDGQGANRLCAGGPVWAAWLAGVGYRDSTGRTSDRWGLAGVGPDGTVAVVLDRETGRELRLIAPDGRMVDVPGAAPDDQLVQVLGFGRAIWTTNGHATIDSLGIDGVPLALLTARAYWLRAVLVAGVWWLLYQDEHDRLLCHRAGSTVGKIITQGNAFRPDMNPAGRVVYAINEGELPADIRSLNVFDLPDQDLRPGTVTPPPVQPPPPPIQPPKEPPVSLRTIPMPPRIPQIVQALYERHRDLAEGDDDQRRQLQILICQQARFELGPEWGSKRADPSRPPSKDSIACLRDKVLYSADCFNGSTRQPAVPNVLEEIPGQVFQEVDPLDSLGVGQPPPPPPPPPPPVDAGIEARFKALEARVLALEQRPQGPPVTPPTVPPAADGAATEPTLLKLLAVESELLDTIKGALSAFGR